MARVGVANGRSLTLFSTGLGFLRRPAAERWGETERRLANIESHNLAADFAALGGAEILTALQDAHAAVGKATGITAAPPAPATPTLVGERLDAWKAAVRCYILQIAANASLDDTAAGRALAARLLAPVAEWESAPRARAEKPAVSPPPPAVPAHAATAG